jgi:regulation of enolase protein 1 (concanavalin A-like superfamily)
LRLVREGDVITAYSRQSAVEPWNAIDSQQLAGLGEPVYVGVAVTSHVDGTSARAIFSGFAVTPRAAGFAAADVGSVSAPGSLTYDGGVYVVHGSGADIWDTEDGFYYRYLPMPGDGTMTVRVTDVNGPHEWSKAGLMIRQSLNPGAVHHYLLVSESNGLAYQRREAAHDVSLHTSLDAAMPVWYRIERIGGSIHLYYSTDAAAPVNWQLVAGTPFPAGDALIGLAVTSHADGLLASATFDNLSYALAGRATGWTSVDVGTVGLTGSHTLAGTTHVVAASGADIWDTVDAFRYTYQLLTGDGSIVARVSSVNAVDEWTKAGVMIRASTDPSSAHAFVFVSRDFGVAFQRRPAAEAPTTHTYGPFATAPMWVRLTRVGQVVTAAASSDGAVWEEVGLDTIAIGSGPVLVGIALTSHDDTILATAVFDGVVVSP